MRPQSDCVICGSPLPPSTAQGRLIPDRYHAACKRKLDAELGPDWEQTDYGQVILSEYAVRQRQLREEARWESHNDLPDAATIAPLAANAYDRHLDLLNRVRTLRRHGWGARRIHAALVGSGAIVSFSTVQRLLRELKQEVV